ncbi:MAG: hypothetical protein WDW36_002226 [Sanguina aurantia]
MFCMAYGLGFGTLVGLAVGPYLFGSKQPRNLEYLSTRADSQDDIPPPASNSVIPEDQASLLAYTEAWTVSPDYQKVSAINRIIQGLWPGLSQAILDSVLADVTLLASIKAEVFDKYSFVDDIILGSGLSLKGSADLSQLASFTAGKQFSTGSVAPRIGGLKIYTSTDDEVTLEIPILWGSNCTFSIGVYLRLGPVSVFVPLELSNLQFKVLARVTLRPLVETLPCLGGVTFTLLEVPFVDFSLKVVQGVDLLSLPLVPQAISYAVQASMLLRCARSAIHDYVVYPNSISQALMPDFGVPSSPQGALRVTLKRAEVTKGAKYLYVKLRVREGRSCSSSVAHTPQDTAPVWNEHFNLIVDDFRTQGLHLELWSDELGFDKMLGEGSLPFSFPSLVEDGLEFPNLLADFIQNTGSRALAAGTKRLSPVRFAKMLTGSLDAATAPEAAAAKTATEKYHQQSRDASTHSFAATHRISGTGAPLLGSACGYIELQLLFLPFLQPSSDTTVDRSSTPDGAPRTKKKFMPGPPRAKLTTNITDTTKGVLTVTLIRAINLVGSTPSLNSFVRLLVSDDDADEARTSSVVAEERSPRWGDRFEFVLVSARSTLHISVMHKPNLLHLSTLTSVFKRSQEEKVESLGQLTLPVQDVARNGRMKDVWQLSGTESGSVELELRWQTCHVSQ